MTTSTYFCHDIFEIFSYLKAFQNSNLKVIMHSFSVITLSTNNNEMSETNFKHIQLILSLLGYLLSFYSYLTSKIFMIYIKVLILAVNKIFK